MTTRASSPGLGSGSILHISWWQTCTNLLRANCKENSLQRRRGRFFFDNNQCYPVTLPQFWILASWVFEFGIPARKICTLITFQVFFLHFFPPLKLHSRYQVWFPLFSNWLEDFAGMSSSLQRPELAVGLRLVILDSRVVLRRLLSESSFLKSLFICMQQGRQCMKSCRRWPLKIMYIQGLQQLLRLASSAERVTAVFSESEEPRRNRTFRNRLALTWLSIDSSCNNKMILYSKLYLLY